MLARRERIVAALVAVVTAGCPATVTRNRRSPVDASEAPHLNVLDGGHVADYSSVGDTAYAMEVDIDASVVAATDALLGPALNTMYASVIAAIMADFSLGGLCEQIRETALDVRIAPTAESAQPLANFNIVLEIEFRTPDGDATG